MADSRLTYAFDGGFLTGAHPPDTPRATENVGDEHEHSTSTNPQSSSSRTNRWSDLSASVRLFSRSFLRMELDEMEMMKAREASRVESEKRRVEAETEMTQMLLNTQLDIASFLLRTSRKRKRKSGEDDDDDDDASITARQGLLLLGLLQHNLSF